MSGKEFLLQSDVEEKLINKQLGPDDSKCKPILEIDINKTKTIFLDHRAILQDFYEHNLKNQDKCYSLKQQLFNFNTKNQGTSNNDDIADESPEPKKIKRSVKCGQLVNMKETSLFEKISNILVKLSNEIIFSTNATVSEELPRFWEEPVEFPQLNGANTTYQFQIYNIDDQLKYLIPPKCRFFNYDVEQLPKLLPILERYDLLIMDPPWRNKYIRRLKRVRKTLGYRMLYDDELAKMPIEHLIHKNTIAAIWCTNSERHQQSLENDLLPKWHLKILNKIKWLKLNTNGGLIGDLNTSGQKQPYELLFLAVHQESDCSFALKLKTVEFIASIPSIIHSHKPPLITLLADYLPKEPKCLELFGRYLQPHFTTIGLEVLKLMDSRLYNEYLVTKY